MKVRLGAFHVGEHEDASPGLHGNAGGQLPAGERDGLRFQGILHGLLHAFKSGKANAGLKSCCHIDAVVLEERILRLVQEVAHGVAGVHAWQIPDGMVEDVQEISVRVG